MAAHSRSVPEAQPCRYCGDPTYRIDDNGALHECCHAWRRVLSFGYPCPSCQIARTVVRAGRLPSRPPPLPLTLPDGSPFVPSGTTETDDARGTDIGPV
jgi:hypothetical protein